MRSRCARLALALAALACKPSADEGGAPSARPPRPSATPPASATASAIPAPPPRRGCRALALSGEVRRLEGGEALKPGESFDGGAWLTLDAGASVTFRHSESTREWTLIGPGRMRPCRGGDEQVAMASGRLRTSAGAARPGAEALVFTPHGVLRYGDAAIEISVEQHRLRALPKSGEVLLEPLDGKTAVLSLPLGREQVTVARRSRTSLEQRCEALAQRASDVGGALTSTAPSAGAELSARAVEHLRARREARFVCGAGESFAAGLEQPERGRLLDRFAALERLYRTLPRPAASRSEAPSPQAPPATAPKP